MPAAALTARNAAKYLVKPMGHGVEAETAGHGDMKAGSSSPMTGDRPGRNLISIKAERQIHL